MSRNWFLKLQYIKLNSKIYYEHFEKRNFDKVLEIVRIEVSFFDYYTFSVKLLLNDIVDTHLCYSYTYSFNHYREDEKCLEYVQEWHKRQQEKDWKNVDLEIIREAPRIYKRFIYVIFLISWSVS